MTTSSSVIRAVRVAVAVVVSASWFVAFYKGFFGWAGSIRPTEGVFHNKSFKLTTLRYAILLCIRCAHYCTTKLLRSVRQLNSGVIAIRITVKTT